VAIYVISLLLMCVSGVSASEDISVKYDLMEQALIVALDHFDGIPYSWETGAHCSTFVGDYMQNLGFPTEIDNERLGRYEPKETSPFPGANTFKQNKRLIRLNEDLNGDYYQHLSFLKRTCPLRLGRSCILKPQTARMATIP